MLQAMSEPEPVLDPLRVPPPQQLLDHVAALPDAESASVPELSLQFLTLNWLVNSTPEDEREDLRRDLDAFMSNGLMRLGELCLDQEASDRDVRRLRMAMGLVRAEPSSSYSGLFWDSLLAVARQPIVAGAANGNHQAGLILEALDNTRKSVVRTEIFDGKEERSRWDVPYPYLQYPGEAPWAVKEYGNGLIEKGSENLSTSEMAFMALWGHWVFIDEPPADVSAPLAVFYRILVDRVRRDIAQNDVSLVDWVWLADLDGFAPGYLTLAPHDMLWTTIARIAMRHIESAKDGIRADVADAIESAFRPYDDRAWSELATEALRDAIRAAENGDEEAGIFARSLLPDVRAIYFRKLGPPPESLLDYEHERKQVQIAAAAITAFEAAFFYVVDAWASQFPDSAISTREDMYEYQVLMEQGLSWDWYAEPDLSDGLDIVLDQTLELALSFEMVEMYWQLLATLACAPLEIDEDNGDSDAASALQVLSSALDLTALLEDANRWKNQAKRDS